MKLLEKVFFSFTHGGEAASLAAGIAVIRELPSKPVHEHIERLGKTLNDGVRSLLMQHKLSDHMELRGYPCRAYLGPRTYDGAVPMLLQTYVQQELLKRGVLFNGQHMLTYSHRATDIRQTLAAYDEVFAIAACALREGDLRRRLEGRILSPVFRPN